jgi:hypothetical protein
MKAIFYVSLILLAIGTTTAETYTIPLQEGWNLISIPIDPNNNTIQNNIKPNIDAIYGWNPVTQDWVYLTYEYENWWGNLTTIEAGRGYWIHATKKQNLTIEGTTPNNPNILLLQGWNLIGLKTKQPLNTTDIKIEYTELYTYYYDWVYRVYAYNSWFGNLNTIEAGKGYWIKINQPYDMINYIITPN